MEPELPPTVCLDGAEIRRQREAKKLTQLYVAKVVGVTTDTISRWENNRYPSVKRENAIRLAEALEASVENILRREPEETAAEAPRPKEKARFPFSPWQVFGLGALLLVLAAGALFFRKGEVPQAGVLAERFLPQYAAPGSLIPVRVRLETEDQVKGFILREHFPAGWKLIEATPPASSLDNEAGTVRWIVKPGEERPLIVYLLKVSSGAELDLDAEFRGEVVANPNGSSAPAQVEGMSLLRTAPYLWADLNGDSVVDDSEMLQASDTVDEMKGVHLDWKLLESIWDAGSYSWVQKKQRFVPVKPPLPESSP
ncbi:MAG: XRE family transcriptional regulator [Desulfuromonas sp.]|uniref:helix-turn-helix transcriptional regulator n=1 Tax=Desulfuromonas sp. TaxID=892 RepID=UPI000CC814E1|nr:helix-turn-helix transcriptional regulator [Desulfuromonas sp.]PLX82855.1 MAG: XRE family transcriptional regulator [Desulfuromonas sp.]